MTEDLEADFLAGMGFDPLRFSPIGTRVSAGAGPATRFAALPSTPAACTARGGTWRLHRSPRCYLGPVGMRGLDGSSWIVPLVVVAGLAWILLKSKR